MTDEIYYIDTPALLPFRWVTLGYVFHTISHSFPMGLCSNHYQCGCWLDKVPFIYFAFPSLSYFPTSYWCFLNPSDKLPALKSLSQDYSGHFHQVISPITLPQLKCLVQCVGTWFKPTQLESFPGNFVQSETGRKELSSLFSLFLRPIIVFSE